MINYDSLFASCLLIETNHLQNFEEVYNSLSFEDALGFLKYFDKVTSEKSSEELLGIFRGQFWFNNNGNPEVRINDQQLVLLESRFEKELQEIFRFVDEKLTVLNAIQKESKVTNKKKVEISSYQLKPYIDLEAVEKIRSCLVNLAFISKNKVRKATFRNVFFNENKRKIKPIQWEGEVTSLLFFVYLITNRYDIVVEIKSHSYFPLIRKVFKLAETPFDIDNKEYSRRTSDIKKYFNNQDDYKYFFLNTENKKKYIELDEFFKNNFTIK